MRDKVDEAASGTLAQRLRAFVRTLPPSICAQLLEALDKAAMSGDPVPGSDIIAAELRSVLGTSTKKRPRTATPSRLFFRLVEPMLIDEELPEKRKGRIERASLAPIWTWLQRGLLPEQTKDFDRRCSDAILAGDLEAAKASCEEFQTVAVAALQEVLDDKASEVEKRRLVSQIGGQRVHDDLKDILVVLASRDQLQPMMDKIVGPIRTIDESQVQFLVSALAPFARGAGGSLLPYAGAIAMAKLAQPWQIMRVIVTACDTSEADRIAASPFAPLFELVLTDIERLLTRATMARRNLDIEKILTSARDFSAFVRAVNADIEIADEPAWNRRFGTVRGKMGELLRTQVETLPGRVRWLLKPHSSGKPSKGDIADEQEIASIELALDLLVLARNNAADFAMNEVSLRVYTDIQSMLDSGINPLVEGLRNASGEDKLKRLKQLEPAVRIASKIFGANYASLLQKAVDVAAGGSAADRKSGKAA